MTIFDLLFIVCFFGALVSLFRAAYLAWRGRWARSVQVLRRLGLGTAAYAAVLVLVSLTSRPKVVLMGERQCFDEWCITVERAARLSQIGEHPTAANARGIFYLVTLRVSNTARRKAQRATDAAVWLIDSGRHRHDPSPRGQRALDATGDVGKDLTTKMQPGGSFERTVVFDVPKDTFDLGLVVSHGRFPGLLIIGDSQSFLHPATRVRLNKLEGTDLGPAE